MAIRPVLLYPHPRLKQEARPVLAWSERARDVAADLVDTMKATQGCVGISAPQVDVDLRIIAVDVAGHRRTDTSSGLLVMADPLVLSRSGWEVGREGCLSLPDITCNVGRSSSVVVRGLTEEREATIECSGFEARAVQHEIDHLDGILILDRVASPSEIYPRMKG